jgi:hypothetical protein
MKRFVVLTSIVALVSLYVPCAWATAPAISDLPDVKLLTGGSPAPKGVISSGLQDQELDAYNVEDFIKDFDDSVSALTIGLTGQTVIDAPPPPLPDLTDTPVPDIELDGANNVDVYGFADAAWARYTVTADDGENPVTEWKAVAKYSTFAMGTPSLSQGRFFNLDLVNDWVFSYVSTAEGSTITLADLEATLSVGAPAVSWAAYMNDVDYWYDPNGNLLGVNPVLAGYGASFSARGWDVSISSTGGLMLTPSGAFSPGPFLIGITATNDADDQDIDVTRVMVSSGMLASATPGGHSAATSDKSETLDGLTPGVVPTPALGADIKVPIQDGSHWTSIFLAAERVNDPAALEIVDLTVDGPPDGTSPGVGEGNALKVSFAPGTTTNPQAIRLFSRAFEGIEQGAVYTFAANIATDIADATHSPTMLMGLTSGLGTSSQGVFLENVVIDLGEGTLSEAYQQDIIPFAGDGWQTISVNYTPPLSAAFWGDLAEPLTEFTSADQDVLDSVVTGPEGWYTVDGYDGHVMKAALKINARADMTDPFSVWLDNLRVYRSAYELDLGLQKTELSTLADSGQMSVIPSIIPQTSGNIDGSFESYTTDLDSIGFVLEELGGNLPPPQSTANGGPFDPSWRFFAVSAASVSVSESGPDHTKSGGSTNCLRIALTGTETTTDKNARAWVDTGVVAGDGGGIYCLELFIAKDRAVNTLASDRQPYATIGMGQLAPNTLGANYGAYFGGGGLPGDVDTDGWMRIVGTGYIRDFDPVLVRAVVQVSEWWNSDVSNFSVPVYIDDLALYQVDDPAKFFDADLFDQP